MGKQASKVSRRPEWGGLDEAGAETRACTASKRVQRGLGASGKVS